jgi:predicted transcriptional regulator
VRATLDKKVRDIMHYGVISVPQDTTAADMCRVMSHNRVSCVAVEDAAALEIIGVVSTTDIIACGAQWSALTAHTRAGALMSTPLLTVDVDDTMQKAIEMMVGHHVHRVMVRSAGRIVGILSTSDVVREIGKTVKGKPESIYSRLERFEAGVSGSGETEVASETVYDVMTHGVLMIPLTLSLRETAKVISEKQVHRVIVTSDAGEMIGIVAAIDILKPWTGHYGSAERDDVIAADVMTQSIEAVEHWRTLGEAMERMAAKHIHALLVLLARGEISGELAARPIMSTGVVHGVNIPIGLVSATDVVREIGKGGRAG